MHISILPNTGVPPNLFLMDHNNPVQNCDLTRICTWLYRHINNPSGWYYPSRIPTIWELQLLGIRSSTNVNLVLFSFHATIFHNKIGSTHGPIDIQNKFNLMNSKNRGYAISLTNPNYTTLSHLPTQMSHFLPPLNFSITWKISLAKVPENSIDISKC